MGTSGDTLYAQTLGSGRSVAIPLASETTLERWARQSNIGRGALIGAFVGGVVGLVAVSSESSDFLQLSGGVYVGLSVRF